MPLPAGVAGDGDHDAVVGAPFRLGEVNRELPAPRLYRFTQTSIRSNATADQERFGADARGSPPGPVQQLFDHQPLKTCEHVDGLLIGERKQLLHAGLVAALAGVDGRAKVAGLSPAQHGRLETAKAKVAQVAFEAGRGKAYRLRVAMRRERIDYRPAWIAEAKQLRYLVVSLAGGIVARAALKPVLALGQALEQMGMTAARDQRERRVLKLDANDRGLDVTFEMVYANQGNATCKAKRLRVGEADEQTADQTWAMRNGNRIEIFELGVRHLERFAHNGHDGPDVLPAREFRHDTAIFLVNIELGRYAGRKDLGSIFHDCGCGLVAGGFNAEDSQTPILTVPLRIEDFHYDLPGELIARHPLVERHASRMLVIDRATQSIRDDQFRNFPGYIEPGDCVVLNNTRVIPARLFGHRPGLSGKIEIFLLRSLNPEGSRWRALVRPGKKLPVGAEVILSDRLKATITAHLSMGEREIELSGSTSIHEELDRIGHVPLPPYIDRPDEGADKERYQTVFAKHRGASAAPTAGLHFTPEILAATKAAIAEITLHVGLGTFQPLSEENLKTLTLHSEFYEISPEASATLKAAKRRVAIGTTSVRTIETSMEGGTGDTNIFITPGYRFQATGAMLTNFHLPGSSLIMLVAAFAGYELTMRAYRHAVAERYRFFSYGDCMLIL